MSDEKGDLPPKLDRMHGARPARDDDYEDEVNEVLDAVDLDEGSASAAPPGADEWSKGYCIAVSNLVRGNRDPRALLELAGLDDAEKIRSLGLDSFDLDGLLPLLEVEDGEDEHEHDPITDDSVDPNEDAPPARKMSHEEHKARHVALHAMLEELALSMFDEPYASKVSVMDTMIYSASAKSSGGRAEELHKALDELSADFAIHNRGRLFSTTTLADLLVWSQAEAESPTAGPESGVEFGDCGDSSSKAG